jgi:hypothetical protein
MSCDNATSTIPLELQSVEIIGDPVAARRLVIILLWQQPELVIVFCEMLAAEKAILMRSKITGELLMYLNCEGPGKWLRLSDGAAECIYSE